MFRQPVTRGLRAPHVLRQGAADIRDLLLELFGVDGFRGAKSFHFWMVLRQTGIQEQGLVRDRLLIHRKDFLNGWILNVQRRHHPHQILAFDLLDLLELTGESGDFSVRLIDRLLLLDDDGVDGRRSVFRSFRIEIHDAFLVADPGHIGIGVVRPFLLFGDFRVHALDRAVHDVLFLVDACALINRHDLIGDVRRQLRVAIENVDLKQVGIADFSDIKPVAQALIGLLPGGAASSFGPFILEFQVVDHRIKHARALDDLKNRGGQLRIVDREIRVALAEDAHVLRGRFYLNEDRRQEFARLKIGDHRRSHQHQEEGQENKDPTDANDPPIIEKVEFCFFSVCHRKSPRTDRLP